MRLKKKKIQKFKISSITKDNLKVYNQIYQLMLFNSQHTLNL